MERAVGLLGGKFLFKSENDGTTDKTKVVCSICLAEFIYHRSSSPLSYRLNAKHPTKNKSQLKVPVWYSNSVTDGRADGEDGAISLSLGVVVLRSVGRV